MRNAMPRMQILLDIACGMRSRAFRALGASSEVFA